MADLVIRGARLFSPGIALSGDSVAVSEGRIVWIGESPEAPAADQTIQAEGRWLTPGLIDCHTHVVYAGSRSEEFEKRLGGVSYQEIAAQGGGILSTVRATREAGFDDLRRVAQTRVDALVEGGVTTLDAKSGYGLDLESEIKCLRVAKDLVGPRIVTGFLGAHSVPAEFRPNSQAYLEYVIESMLAKAEEECDYVDAFCETVAFSPAQVSQLFERCTKPVRLHADQLSNSGGGALAAKFQALSADHLEYVSEDSMDQMAEAGTVAVLLPGAYHQLREKVAPPVLKMRERGIRMAVATDLNPGTSPIASLPTAMNMACLLFGLTIPECWLGVTLNAAAAVGRPDLGGLRLDAPADLALWDFDHPRDLVATIGMPFLHASWCAGSQIFPRLS